MTIAGTLASPTLANSIINVSFPLAYYELIMVATVFRGFVRNGVCAPPAPAVCIAASAARQTTLRTRTVTRSLSTA